MIVTYNINMNVDIISGWRKPSMKHMYFSLSASSFLLLLVGVSSLFEFILFIVCV